MLREEFKPSRWTYLAATALPRQPGEVMVEPWVREALIALNPEIAEQSDRADEVIYALPAILMSFTAWLRDERRIATEDTEIIFCDRSLNFCN